MLFCRTRNGAGKGTERRARRVRESGRVRVAGRRARAVAGAEMGAVKASKIRAMFVDAG